jgi:hypothetical protein
VSDQTQDAQTYQSLMSDADTARAIERLRTELQSGDSTTVREPAKNLGDFATGAAVAAVKRHLKGKG